MNGGTTNSYVEFPDSFLWGAATASHQVEGNNHNNDWWWHEQNGDLPFKSGPACEHYTRYEDDFDLARSLGHNAHRLSIEWSRIEPRDGEWDEEALQHYVDVIAALRTRGLEPVVTLHHFTNPLWFAQTGGWLRADCADRFRRYTEKVASALDNVRYWITINEPSVYVKNGYGVGCWPPFREKKVFEAVRLYRRFAQAHIAAYRALHDAIPGAMVGLAHSAPYVVACRSKHWLDRLAARSRDFMLNDLFFELMKLSGRTRSVRDVLDFIGINYYSRTIIRHEVDGLRTFFGTECRDSHHADMGRENELGWVIHAPGLYEVSSKFADYGVPVMVTENGLATTNDEERATFIREHLHELARAIRDGIDVRGYLYWTLMDNYEWAEGTNAHFGLVAVDATTRERTPRQSSRVYAEICRANRLEVA